MLIQGYSGKIDQISKSVKKVQVNYSKNLAIYSASVILKRFFDTIWIHLMNYDMTILVNTVGHNVFSFLVVKMLVPFTYLILPLTLLLKR